MKKNIVNDAKNSKEVQSADRGIIDLVNILNDDQVDEIIENGQVEDPQIFECLRCYLEHLQTTDTKHVAKFIANFCFSDAAQELDPIFYFSAAQSLIHCLLYKSTDLSDFFNHDFFMSLFEIIQNEKYRTFSIMILKYLLGRMKSKSINFLDDNEIEAYYHLIIDICNTFISAEKDKTKISDETCFLILSFSTCLEEIPETLFSEELSSIIKENLKLALESSVPSIINLGLYSIFVLHDILDIDFQIQSYKDYPERNQIIPILLRLCTVLPNEAFANNEYPFSFEEIMSIALDFNSTLFSSAQSCISIFCQNEICSQQQIVDFVSQLIDLILVNENAEIEQTIPTNFVHQSLLTLTSFNPSLLIEIPQILHPFYSFLTTSSSTDNFLPTKFILAAILKMILYAKSVGNKSFIDLFIEETSQCMDDLSDVTTNESSIEEEIQLATTIIDIFNELTEQ